MSDPGLQFSFPVDYHSRALDQRVRKRMTLSNRDTALLLHHVSNMGYPGPLEWCRDSPYADVLSMFGHVRRTRKIIDEKIVPLVEAARKAGLQIMHVIDGWRAAERYPQWEETSGRVPEPENGFLGQAWLCPSSPNRQWMEEYEAEAFGPGYGDALRRVREIIDVAPPVVPRPEDWVVTTTNQVKALMSERGLWNLLYTGFNVDDEMLYCEMGMYPNRKYFRCFILGDCTACVERHDTIDGEKLKNATIAFLEMGLAYRTSGAEIQRAMAAARP